MRARHHFEDMEKGNRQSIVFTEIPYQLNKAKVIEKIAELVKEKKLEGISELRDESDKDGMRIVIELRRGENADVVVNNLFIQTQLQGVFGINMVALNCLILSKFLNALLNTVAKSLPVVLFSNFVKHVSAVIFLKV